MRECLIRKLIVAAKPTYTLIILYILSEFVTKPIDESNNAEEQQLQVDTKGSIFHFGPVGVYAFIQVQLVPLNGIMVKGIIRLMKSN
jgi:hypothetical protein